MTEEERAAKRAEYKNQRKEKMEAKKKEMMEMWEKKKTEWVAKIQEKTGWSETQAQAFYK